MKRRGALHGILWMIAAQVLFVVSWTAIKFLGERLPLFQIVFFRGFISFIFLIFFTIWKERTIRGKNYSALFLRSLFGFLAMVLAFYAMIRMEIGNAAVLFNTLPIFVALLAPPILGEAFSSRKLILVIIAFAGIVMILKPDRDILQGAAIYPVIAGLMGALAMLFVRKMAVSDSALIITLYFTAFITACSAPMAIVDYVPPTLSEWGWLLMIGTALTGAQVFTAHGYKFGHASTIAPFSYVSVIGAYLAGLWLFDELPDLWSGIGAALIVLSGIGIMFSTPRTVRREEIRSTKVT